jgi:uncharacterized tellurite resistance protein B-like protein
MAPGFSDSRYRPAARAECAGTPSRRRRGPLATGRRQPAAGRPLGERADAAGRTTKTARRPVAYNPGMQELTAPDRLRLMKFVCSFAWADLAVGQAERALVARLAERLQLTEEEQRQVAGWLALPPPPEEVDPQTIPADQRALFIRAARAIISVDGKLSDAETDAFDLLERMLR